MSKGRAASMTVIYDICRAEQSCSSGCHYPLQDEDLTLGLHGAHKNAQSLLSFCEIAHRQVPINSVTQEIALMPQAAIDALSDIQRSNWEAT